MNSLQLCLSIIIGILPIYFIGLKENNFDRKKSLLYTGIYGIFNFILSSAFVLIYYKSISYISLGIGVLFSMMINYQIFRGLINLKKIPLGIIVVLLFFFSSFTQIIPISIFNLDVNNFSAIESALLSCYSDIILFIILVAIYFKDLKKGIKDFFKNFGRQSDNCFRWWSVGLFLMMVSNILISIFAPSAVAGNENAVQEMIDRTPMITFISACILAPFIEEITFRKTFLDVFKNKWFCVIFSGFIFGLLHVIFSYTSLYDFLYIIPYGSLGAAFCYMDIKNDNVISSIFMHTLHNSFVVLLSIFTGMIVL